MQRSTSPRPSEIHTEGGAAVSGDANPGRDFIGRDQITQHIHLGISPIPSSQLAESDLVLLNFARPLTPTQRGQIEVTLGYRIARIISLPIEFEDTDDFGPQVVDLADQAGLTAHEWQTLPILINPPGFAAGALCLLSELHGRMGHFPTMIRLRPRPHSNPAAYDVAELVNLQALRDAARKRNQKKSRRHP